MADETHELNYYLNQSLSGVPDDIASLVIDAVTIEPPTSMRTWAVVAPFVTSTTVPFSRLRALIFMAFLLLFAAL